MRAFLPDTNEACMKLPLGISNRPIALINARALFHVVTLLTVVVSGSVGLLLFCGYLPGFPLTGIVLIALAGVIALLLAVCLILTLCISCSQLRKKRLLQDYTALVQKDPDAALAGDPSKKLRDWLNAEWETSSQFALMQPSSAVQKTIMGDPQVFKNLQEGKFTYELEMFRGFLKKDLTGDQRQKVTELEAQMRKRFSDEMHTLAAHTYMTRTRYTTMVDFFIILENDMIEAAIDAGLSDYKLPEYELKISHLSLSGGGARGYAYGEMFKKLKPTFMPNCRFSGTSAGAIGALAAAFNMNDFVEFALEMQRRYDKSARDNREWAAAYGWLRPQFASWPSYYDLTGVLALFDQRVQERVSTFLRNITDETIDNTFPDLPEVQARMRLLREPYDPTVSREGKLLTFHDLELLQRLPGGKEQFHDLAAAIWDTTDQKLIFAKKKTQPNMPVILAVYASMSIPLAFKLLALPLAESDGKPHQLCDGGCGANLPIQAYDDGDEQISGDGETVGVVFDGHGWGGKMVRGNVKTLPKYIRRALRLLRIAPNVEGYVHAEKERLKRKLKEIIILPHGRLDTASFNFSEEERKAIDHQVGLRTEAWKICKIRGTNWPNGIWATVTPLKAEPGPH
ncbi:MAG: patatin-like phospholipase family protein [Puniceicoccales bacterium]|jgi:predicted acylesterase/phospholipase RssA|nr:patatin-like phospholipase family protein [Puniceicoccales bacterium]